MKILRIFTVFTTAALITLMSASSAFAKQPVLDVSYEVDVVKSIADTTNSVPNMTVNMYKVKVIKNQYVGTLVKTMSTGKDGYKAVFTIKPGDIVDFLAFKSKSVALNSKNKKHTFTVPPHKNFGKEDGVAGLCYTAGIDTTKKLTNSKTGKDMCTTGENGYIQAYYEVTK